MGAPLSDLFVYETLDGITVEAGFGESWEELTRDEAMAKLSELEEKGYVAPYADVRQAIDTPADAEEEEEEEEQRILLVEGGGGGKMTLEDVMRQFSQQRKQKRDPTGFDDDMFSIPSGSEKLH